VFVPSAHSHALVHVPDYGDGAVGSRWLSSKAGAKISEAEAGQSLERYNSETHPSSMWGGMANDEEANYHAAYWYAVGAKIANGMGKQNKARSLIQHAKTRLDRADNMALVPFFGDDWKDGPTVIANAKTRLKQLGDKGKALVFAIERQGTEESRRSRQRHVYETSFTGKYVEPVIMTGRDIGKGVKGAADFWGKYGLYVSLAIGGIVLLYVAGPVLAPAARAARKARKRSKAAGRAIEEASDVA